ncbi:MAG TPA: ATP-binding protein [Limnochordia bacterium]|nr:ATP-binding protein [Limnochordia bacterium]
MLVLALLLLLLALVTAWALSALSAQNRALGQLRAAVQRIAGGDYAHRIDIDSERETALLAVELNRMSGRMEAALAELRHRQSDLEGLLAAIPDAVITVDRRERVTQFNPAAERILGQPARNAYGKPLQRVIRHFDVVEAVQRAVAAGEDRLLELRTFDRVYDARITAVHAGGETIGAVVLLHDITALRRLEQVRKDFVANVAHELRTPLTSILGFLESLLDGALDEPELARRFVGIAKQEADRLVVLVRDLLQLSRLESDAPIAAEPIPLAPQFARLTELFAERAKEKSIALEIRCEPELKARVDPQMLHQVLLNLVDNAIKYTPDGGRVGVFAERDGGGVRIAVEDTGIGLAEAHLERVFERFYRVDKGRSRDEGGTGLGLAIVKHIAERHGGRAWAESRLGKGSRFFVWFPEVGL